VSTNAVSVNLTSVDKAVDHRKVVPPHSRGSGNIEALDRH
jgi:hypothetical protein